MGLRDRTSEDLSDDIFPDPDAGRFEVCDVATIGEEAGVLGFVGLSLWRRIGVHYRDSTKSYDLLIRLVLVIDQARHSSMRVGVRVGLIDFRECEFGNAFQFLQREPFSGGCGPGRTLSLLGLSLIHI